MDIKILMRDTFYDQVDPRRRQEVSDARMIREDHRAIANLSEKAIHQEFNPDKFRFDALRAGSPRRELGDKEYY